MQTNLYPSTNDASVLPPIAGASGEDEVLLTLQTALKRVRRRWTRDYYVNSESGAVCAVGAVIAADGKTRAYNKNENENDLLDIVRFVDQRLGEAAKEAIGLLDQAAYALYSESDDVSLNTDNWPIESINQALGKDAVIRCYEYAIEQRQAVPA